MPFEDDQKLRHQRTYMNRLCMLYVVGMFVALWAGVAALYITKDVQTMLMVIGGSAVLLSTIAAVYSVCSWLDSWVWDWLDFTPYYPY